MLELLLTDELIEQVTIIARKIIVDECGIASQLKPKAALFILLTKFRRKPLK